MPPALPATSRRRWRRGAAAVVVTAGLVAGGIGLGRLDTTAGDDATRAAAADAVAAPEQLAGEETSDAGGRPQAGDPPSMGDQDQEPVAAVAAAVAPAVVQLETGTGLGSGVIYDADGYLLTAAHVVNGSDGLRVRLADGTVLEGQVLGADASTDVAVVEVEADGELPTAALALDTAPEVGQMAVAIGSPFGLDQTVTAGIVSAVNRVVPTPDGAVGMIQTDAPINPGNSGGALVDREGRVIGINDAIHSQSGGNVGVGFAIPIATAAEVADAIVSGDPIETGYLGVSSRDAVTGEPGALIAAVEDASPAAEAGLRAGDRVTELDGQPVRGTADLVALVRAADPGQEIAVTVARDGEELTVDVVLTSR